MNDQVSNHQMIEPTRKRTNYDLEERTLDFGKRVVRLVKVLPKNVVNLELGKQVVRSGTSVGANYREATEAESKRDFVHKLRIAKKEVKETTYWIDLIAEANPDLEGRLSASRKESRELLFILAASIDSALGKRKKLSNNQIIK